MHSYLFDSALWFQKVEPIHKTFRSSLDFSSYLITILLYLTNHDCCVKMVYVTLAHDLEREILTPGDFTGLVTPMQP